MTRLSLHKGNETVLEQSDASQEQKHLMASEWKPDDNINLWPVGHSCYQNIT